MNTGLVFLIGILSFSIGAIIAWISAINKSGVVIATLKAKLSGLEERYNSAIDSARQNQQFIENAQKNLRDSFEALSSKALRDNNSSFIELAKSRLEEKTTEAKGELE